MPQPSPRRVTFVLGVLTAFGAASIDMYLPSLPAIGASLHASPASVQLTLATFMVGMGVGQLVYGPVSDRWGRRAPLFFGITLYVIASLGCAWAPTIEVLIGARFLQALGGAAGPVLARAIVRDLYAGREIARVLSLMMLVMGAVPILAPLAGGGLLTLFGWRAIFGVLAAFGVLAFALALNTVPRTRALESTGTLRQNLGALVGDPIFVSALFAGTFGGAALFAYIGSASYVFMSVYHFSPQEFALVFGFNAAGFIGASQLNRYLLVRATPAALRHGAAITMAATSGLLVVQVCFGEPPVGVIAVNLFFSIGCIGMVLPNSTAAALTHHAARAGIASSILGAASFAMAAVVTALAGTLHDGTARPMAIVVAMCAAATLAASERLRRVTSHYSASSGTTTLSSD